MINTIKPLAEEFMSHCQKKYGFKHPPKINFVDDGENAQDPLGKTAHYDTQDKSITLYITNRHPKDILRSLAHELTHHLQHLRGELDDVGELGEGYAQSDEHMRKMEIEAYASGIDVRDWADSKNNIQKENKTMNAKQEALLRALIKEQIKKVLGKLEEGDTTVAENVSLDPRSPHKFKGQKREEIPAGLSPDYDEPLEPAGYDDEDPDDFEARIRARMARMELDENTEEEINEGDPDSPASRALTRGIRKAQKTQPDDEKEEEDKANSPVSQALRRGFGPKNEAELEAIQTPEQENALYESRFTMRDTKIFEKLLKKWAN